MHALHALFGIGVLYAWIGLLLVIGVWVYQYERVGRRMPALHVLLGAVVMDGALFPADGSSNGFLRPSLGPLAEPWIFYLIPVLVVGRWLAPGRKPVFTYGALAWLAFLGWTTVQLIAGVEAGHDIHPVILEGKMIVYVAGALLLTAGIPRKDLLGPKGLPRVALWMAPIAGILVVTTALGIVSNKNLHEFHLVNSGPMGADVATVFATTGLIVLALALASRPRSTVTVLASLFLIVAPAFTGQRASLLAVGTSAVLLFVAAVFSKRRVIRLMPTDATAMLAVVAALAGAICLVSLTGALPNLGTDKITNSFTSQGKKDSAQARINQWDQAIRIAREKPFIGHGLGVEYTYIEPVKDAPDHEVSSDLTHDIFLDQLLRSGLVGVILLVLALGTSIGQGVLIWRRDPFPAAAALGGAAAAALAGLVVRGSVESILEKERLCVVLGLLVGILHNLRSQRPAREDRSAETLTNLSSTDETLMRVSSVARGKVDQ